MEKVGKKSRKSGSVENQKKQEIGKSLKSDKVGNQKKVGHQKKQKIR